MKKLNDPSKLRAEVKKLAQSTGLSGGAPKRQSAQATEAARFDADLKRQSENRSPNYSRDPYTGKPIRRPGNVAAGRTPKGLKPL
jgi:hypothetical protein